MTSKNRKWPGKTNFDVSLLKYLSDRNKTFTTLILHIGLHSDKVWKILNFLILHVLPDCYRQPLLIHIFVSLTYLSLPRPYLMIHLTLFTGIQYIKFTAVGERAVHLTITTKICRNFVVMQLTLSNCSCFTIFKHPVNFSVSWL
jgi:hypothetical protein